MTNSVQQDRIDQVAKRLRAFILHHRPEAAQLTVEDIRRSPGGSSRENWLFDARWVEGDQPHAGAFVLRRDPEEAIADSDRKFEFDLLSRLGETHVPTAQARWLDLEGRWFGRPSIVMDRAPGRDDRKLLTDANQLGLSAGQRLWLAKGLCDHLAQIHRLAPEDVGLTSSPDPARMALSTAIAEMHRNDVSALPEIALIEWWLHDNLPPPPPEQAVVHGDYRPANVLVDDGRISAILDWEFAHGGDPAEDLGWYLAPIYTGEHFIPGQWTASDFIARYQQQTGRRVEMRAIRFWSVLGMYRLTAMVVAGADIMRRGQGDRVAPSARIFTDPALAYIRSIDRQGQL